MRGGLGWLGGWGGAGEWGEAEQVEWGARWQKQPLR